MKQLLMIALLVMTTFITKAQFDNNTSCDLRIRTICIDETTTPCSVTSTGSWQTLPANTPAITITGVGGICTGGLVQGYEIDYHPSTGCDGNSVRFTTNAATSCTHGVPAWPPMTNDLLLPGCTCNDNNPIRIMFQYEPSMSIFEFDAD